MRLPVRNLGLGRGTSLSLRHGQVTVQLKRSHTQTQHLGRHDLGDSGLRHACTLCYCGIAVSTSWVCGFVVLASLGSGCCMPRSLGVTCCMVPVDGSGVTARLPLRSGANLATGSPAAERRGSLQPGSRKGPSKQPKGKFTRAHPRLLRVR